MEQGHKAGTQRLGRKPEAGSTRANGHESKLSCEEHVDQGRGGGRGTRAKGLVHRASDQREGNTQPWRREAEESETR
eukprot:4498528-Alexandrium_andersonii.AAC.1